jgi:hypothetical protein
MTDVIIVVVIVTFFVAVALLVPALGRLTDDSAPADADVDGRQ